jgi:hypothetical protein
MNTVGGLIGTNHKSPLTAPCLPGVILLRQFELSFITDRLDLSSLPFSPADQVANQKLLERRDQRHREDKKNTGEGTSSLLIRGMLTFRLIRRIDVVALKRSFGHASGSDEHSLLKRR